jgi:uncharacterized phage-associated protein
LATLLPWLKQRWPRQTELAALTRRSSRSLEEDKILSHILTVRAKEVVMTISVLSAAKRLAMRSNWTLSNLEMQKILYLAHMFYLGRTKGEPLVSGRFEAWDYGPVHPDLYHRLKVFGASPVRNVFHEYSDIPDGPQAAIIDEAYDSLGNAGPGRLVNATHRKGGAWSNHYIPGQRHCIIPNADIQKEYSELENVKAAA